MNVAVVLALGLSGASSIQQTQPTAVPPAAQAQAPEIFTVFDERIVGKPTAIENGKLVLATEPPRLVPLDEIARISLASAPDPVARWIGQDNHDAAQVGAAAGGNGIQDVHIAITGLPTGQKIKQVVVVCPHPMQRGIWRLDTTGSPNWKLVLERSEGSETADLYLEPNQDNFDQPFNITINYENGTTVEITTKATTHTDPQLKVSTGETQPTPTDSGPARVLAYLEAGDRVGGELLSLSTESLKLRTTRGTELEIPLLHVLAIEFGTSLSQAAKQKIEQQLRNPGAEDTALVLGQDQSITSVSGSVQGLEEGKLRFAYQGEVRSINQPRLAALVFASHPPARKGLAPYQQFQLASGDQISGTWTAIEGDSFKLQTTWDRTLELPSSIVTNVLFRNGKMVYLSDLEPAAVDEVPYFGRLMTYRRDQNLVGGPLQMKGKTYTKGLAVHSRCVLTFAVDGQFQAFKCLVGFDDPAGNRGRVVCRVLGDGKELFAERDLRGDHDPKPLELPISGVKQLALEVDFGDEEDIGDRVIWADARLFRLNPN